MDELKGLSSCLERAAEMVGALKRTPTSPNDDHQITLVFLSLQTSSAVLRDCLKDDSAVKVMELYMDDLKIVNDSLEIYKKAILSSSYSMRSASNRGLAPTTPALDAPDDSLTAALHRLQRDVRPDCGLSSVAGLAEAKQLLRDAVVMPLRYHHLFTGARKPWSSVLLYGPPGTGKTRLAHAVAAEVEAEFYVVTPADLLSKWFGETEQKIRDLFGLLKARARTRCCIVFLDEVDGLCRRRTDGEAESTRRMKTELLNQLQEQTTESKDSSAAGQLFFLCATNCPWEIDSAFLRRFQRRIFISLPSREGRLDIIRALSLGSDLELQDSDWEHLLDRTDGFSGSDLADLVKGALYQPLRELSTAKNWVPKGDNIWMPCSSNRIGAVRRELNSFLPSSVCARNVTVMDFIAVMANTRPTVCQEDIDRYDHFTSRYGQFG